MGTFRADRRSRFRLVAVLSLLGVLSVGVSGESLADSAAASSDFLVKLNVRDLKKSVEFYTGILGLKEVERAKEGEANSIEISLLNHTGKHGGAGLVLSHDTKQKPADSPQLGSYLNHVIVVVKDLDQVTAKLAAAGFKISNRMGPLPSPMKNAKQASVAFTNDPDGIPVEILQFD